METKQDIRKNILEMRKRVPKIALLQKSGIICKKLMQLPEYREAECIYTYVSLPGEVWTDTLINEAWKAGKKVAVPKVTGDRTMEFYEIDSWDMLKEGHFHVLEPAANKKAEYPNALMIMPGVAFDEHRHRIGYGKGYYDAYLEKEPNHTTIALAFSFQIAKEVPFEVHDKLPDRLITEHLTY